jgi:hypothetical protein
LCLELMGMLVRVTSKGRNSIILNRPIQRLYPQSRGRDVSALIVDETSTSHNSENLGIHRETMYREALPHDIEPKTNYELGATN